MTPRSLKTRRAFLAKGTASGLTLLLRPSLASAAVTTAAEWQREFQSPPSRYKPRTRWWWPGSAVSREGIDHQLRQMHQQGLGGVEIICCWEWYEKGNIPYLSEEWQSMVRHACDRAAELDMQVAITYSPGWDLGGFWVPPEDRSKVLAPVWIDVDGPGDFALELPQFDRSRTPSTGLYEYLTKPDDAASDAHKIVGVVAGRLTGPNVLGGDSLVDLTASLRGDTLRWRIPEGRWRVAAFRLEYTGQQNASQNYSPRNWIVDHYSKTAMQRYCDYLTGAFRKALGDRLGRVVDAFFSDSFEVMPLMDTILWSNGILEAFRARKGYDLRPLLPALWWHAGEITERVRYDVNEFLHEVTLDAVYDTFRNSAASVKVESKTQPHYRFSTEIIQGAGASARPETEVTTARFETVADPRKATVAGARFYGRQLVSAEAYTFLHQHRYLTTPEELKIATDAFLRDGITQFYNHGYVYSEEQQPSTTRDVPFAERISHWNTWWPYYHHVAEYVSRCCYLMRQGEIVADVLLYSPQAEVWTRKAVWNGERRVMPYGDLPKLLVANGYDYDPVNDDVLQRLATAAAKQIRVGKHAWRVLILQNVTAMPVATMRAIARLIQAGVPVIALGRLPDRGVGRAEAGAGDDEVARLASRIPHFLPEYSFVDVPFVSNEQPWRPTPPVRPAGRKLLSVLAGIVAPDFSIGNGEQSNGLTFQHRRASDADIYFVTNLQPTPASTRISLRTASRSVEWWNARTGGIRTVEAARVTGGRTELPVSFAPWESAFLILRDKAGRKRSTVARASSKPAVLEISGPWQFRAGRHLSTLTKLESWTRKGSPLETYSGPGEYSCRVDIPAEYRSTGTRLILSLGSVGCVAEVKLNSRDCGVAWMSPWEVDITGAARSGANELAVLVTNLRIHEIQAQKDPKPVPPELRGRYGNERSDYTNSRLYMQRLRPIADPPPSGLLGPVRVFAR